MGSGPLVRLPPHRWSKVLNDVPVPLDYSLAFYDSDDALGVSVAHYRADASPAGAADDWFRAVMPALGWSPVRETPQLQQWNRGGRRLDLRMPAGVDPVLRIECRPACPRNADGRSLVHIAELPTDARRLRYDPGDLLVEELIVPSESPAAREAVSTTLRSRGWRVTASDDLSGVAVDRYSRGDDTIVVAVWPSGDGRAAVGLGMVDCLAENRPWADWPQPDTAVYLAQLPAPPASQVVSFSPEASATVWTEAWRSDCLDLDLASAVFAAGATAGTWRTAARVRGPGSAQTVFRGEPDGLEVTALMRSEGGGAVSTRLTARGDAIRVSAGQSLLFPDLPVPSAAMPGRLDTGVGRPWPIVEVYVPPAGAVAGREDFYRRRMPDTGWRFDRLEPAGVGPSQVYFQGGEVVSIGFASVGEDVPAVSLARRRVCPTDDVLVEPGDGRPAAHMAEMTVFPGADFRTYDATGEHYEVACSSLDVMAAWYRRAMETGDWALASTVGPADAFHRELLFVRPDERALPPEERTAWAVVRLDRPWPYEFRFSLLRDPYGVRWATRAP